eukprot:m.71559 g.71559  ORF g.71559 m.71559 type:complete len:51 (+) comp13824_c0_seq1:732-884(+)
MAQPPLKTEHDSSASRTQHATLMMKHVTKLTVTEDLTAQTAVAQLNKRIK